MSSITHDDILWYETGFEGNKIRIRRLSEDDAVVEKFMAGDGWEPVDDDALCARVYLRAFLKSRK